MVYQFRQEQQLNTTIETAWSFFSSPKNLAAITPDKMDFKIIGEEPKPMYAGQIVQYTVRPLFNLPLRWVTEITQVRAPYFFVDEQRKGPYKLWHHQHSFEENEAGVLMNDIVTYEPPFGFIGQLANELLIRKEIEEIFSYREQFLNNYFNSEPNEIT